MKDVISKAKEAPAGVRIPDRYVWEAERAGGEITRLGADLSDCVRFSLVPKAPQSEK